jgi:hypothetical protein
VNIAPVKDPKNFPASGAAVWISAPTIKGTSINPPGTFSMPALTRIAISLSDR